MPERGVNLTTVMGIHAEQPDMAPTGLQYPQLTARHLPDDAYHRPSAITFAATLSHFPSRRCQSSV